MRDSNSENGVVPLSLRPKAAAVALGISPRKLWQLTNSGVIPCVRLGRAVIYPVESLRAWLEENAKGRNATVR
ncbi:MAG: helix-turn-helix domain-containing protein [Planctomycetes bacterium]|nr:helix-turn-helix domain-containing protein [Planctomycetota bacterium]